MGDVGEDQLDLNNPPFPLTAIDRELLVTKDEDFHRITWADLKAFIGIADLKATRETVSHVILTSASKQTTS